MADERADSAAYAPITQGIIGAPSVTTDQGGVVAATDLTVSLTFDSPGGRVVAVRFHGNLESTVAGDFAAVQITDAGGGTIIGMGQIRLGSAGGQEVCPVLATVNPPVGVGHAQSPDAPRGRDRVDHAQGRRLQPCPAHRRRLGACSMTDFPVTDTFARTANAVQLQDEARGAVPLDEWPASFTRTEDGWAYRVDRKGVDTDAVRAALDAHTPKPVTDPDAEFLAALEAATTVTQLREALLGKAGPGAQARRPTQ
jgi:hypothetical protein